MKWRNWQVNMSNVHQNDANSLDTVNPFYPLPIKRNAIFAFHICQNGTYLFDMNSEI